MSVRKTYAIRCPHCGREQTVELYDTVNVSQEPELKTALYENRLNRVQCAGCDAAFRVDKPLLYHDADRRILIHWMPDIMVSRDEIFDEFDRTMEELRAALPEGMDPPRVRLVFTRPELVELIFMIEAGMDERAVEYVKYTIHTQNMERVPPQSRQLLLNVQDSTDDEILFAIQNVESGELEDLLRYPRRAYENVCEMIEHSGEEVLELFPGPYINARDRLLRETPDAT